MDRKQAHERDVFMEFAVSAGMPVDPRTVDLRQPPEPDLRCLIDNQSVYFELGRLLDEGMQRFRLRMLRASPNQVAPDMKRVKLPEREMLCKKLAKTYTCTGAPIELVLYYDNESMRVGDVPFFSDQEWPWHAGHVMVPLIESSPRVFRRIWVFDRHRRKVLWHYPNDAVQPSSEGTGVHRL